MNRRLKRNRLKPVAAPAGKAVRTPRPGLRAWREQHLYGFFSSFGRLMSRPWATALTIAVLSLALAVPLLFWLLVDNAGTLGGHVDDAGAMNVFLKPGLDAEQVGKLARQLRSNAQVTDVTVRTPEQGLQEFRQRSGFADALKVLHDNPLPALIIVKLKDARTRSGTPDALLGELRGDARVDLVQYDVQWRQRLNAILALARRGASVLAVLLALAALLVVGNTVRLDIQGRYEEIAVMQLLGASDAFVRRPFLYAGFWYGLLSGFCCLILIGIVEWILAAPLTRLVTSYDHRFSVHGLSVAGMFVVLCVSIGLGWLGAGLTASRHIAQGQPR